MNNPTVSASRTYGILISTVSDGYKMMLYTLDESDCNNSIIACNKFHAEHFQRGKLPDDLGLIVASIPVEQMSTWVFECNSILNRMEASDERYDMGLGNFYIYVNNAVLWLSHDENAVAVDLIPRWGDDAIASISMPFAEIEKHQTDVEQEDEPQAETAEPVSLVPGLQTAEAQQQFQKLLDRRNHLDYQCFMFLRDNLKDIIEALHSHATASRIDLDSIANLLNEVHGNNLLEQMQNLIDERETVNNEMMRLIAGRQQ